MFENKTVFLIVKENIEDAIYKIETDASTQNEINRIFSVSAQDVNGKQKVPFDGRYTPLEDEVLSISSFILPDIIKDALRNPVTVEPFQPDSDNMQNIRAICIGYCENTEKGEKFVAAFRRFRREQYISLDKISLFFDNNTFKQKKGIGISIGFGIDCLFDDGTLNFISFYYARQVFDLSGYYRTATDEDIREFFLVDTIDFGEQEQANQFKDKANSWVRRKIASINDSGILKNYTAMEIKRIAKKHSGIDITVKDNAIVFPTAFEEAKILLSFLDENLWIGAFTNETFISSSKRKVGR